MLYFSVQFILNKLVNEQFLFAANFSYSIFSKTTDFVKVVKMSSKRRQCRNHPDVFCYICGEHVLEKYRFYVRDFTKKAYKAYLGIKLGDQEKSWAPHKVCKQCTETLRLWTKSKVSCMWFGIPMVWREPKNHHDDCFFCVVDMTGWNQRKKKEWCYPDQSLNSKELDYFSELELELEKIFFLNSNSNLNSNKTVRVRVYQKDI